MEVENHSQTPSECATEVLTSIRDVDCVPTIMKKDDSSRDVLISFMMLEMIWMSIWSLSASPWTAMWSPRTSAFNLSRYCSYLSYWRSRRSMKLIKLSCSFGAPVSALADYRGWWLMADGWWCNIISEVGGTIMCVWVLYRLFPQTSVVMLDTNTIQLYFHCWKKSYCLLVHL